MKNLGPTENIGSPFSDRNARPLAEVLGSIENIGSLPVTGPHDRGDVLVEALRCDRLQDFFGVMIPALGIVSTNVIADHFTAKDLETFARLPNAYQKATFIASWLTAELQAAAERIHGFPVERTTQR